MSEKITVPTLGESVTEATVSKWLKSQGDKVIADEPVVELETDKVNVEVPAPSNGILGSIEVQEGETVNVGSLLGTINDNLIKDKPSSNEIKNYSPPEKGAKQTPTIFKDDKSKSSPKKINKKKEEQVLQLNDESLEEEPKNMGAWNTVRNYIERTLEIINFGDINVKYVGRQASSSTATGNANKHLAQQNEILEKILRD